MPEIIIQPDQKIITYEPGKKLLSILLEKNIFVENPCSGKGVCGKCKILWKSGIMPPLTATERKWLKPEEIRAGVRLACLVEPSESIEIELMQKERKHKVLTSGYVPEFSFAPFVQKSLIEIKKPSLEDQRSLEDRLIEASGVREFDWKLLKNFTKGYGLFTGVYYGEQLISVEEGDTTGRVYGIAVDIGTTTVAAAMIDLVTGEEVVNISDLNSQKKYGLDVLSRITYEVEHGEEGILELQATIVSSLNEMINKICIQTEILCTELYEITVSANCTMMHMLLGIPAVSIGRSPYTPVFTSARTLPTEEIGLKMAKGARLYCIPAVSAYIGADIVAGAYVCELYRAAGSVLFIDIGTNGEIVLSKNGRMVSCSCAAGPALEGMNISIGMRAAEGAIEDVKITEQEVCLKVIGESEPIGICGSGILAVIKEMVNNGILKRDGAFIKKETLSESDYRNKFIRLESFNSKKREFMLSEKPRELVITQGDIRQVQLAKGAILSGFYALLNRSGISMEQLDKILIAGQFGAYLPVESLIGVGLLPAEVKDKLVYVGNSSKTGAYMALMSSVCRRQMEDLARKIDYMELGNAENYERLFLDCLSFPAVSDN